MHPETPPSYYVKTNGDVEEIKGHGWNIEANLTPIEQASIWGGYSEVKFDDIGDQYNILNSFLLLYYQQ